MKAQDISWKKVIQSNSSRDQTNWTKKVAKTANKYGKRTAGDSGIETHLTRVCVRESEEIDEVYEKDDEDEFRSDLRINLWPKDQPGETTESKTNKT